MTSILPEDRHETVDLSQTSEDLFQDSITYDCKGSLNSPVSRILNFSDTSEEVAFVTRRKPRKALDLSQRNSIFHSVKSSGSFKCGLNSSTSKYFCPISPNRSAAQTSFSFKGSPEDVPKCAGNSTENNIDLVSESSPSESSSILDNSSGDVSDDNCTAIHSKSVKVPLHSSAKKHLINDWLSGLSPRFPLTPKTRGVRFDLPRQGNAIDYKHHDLQLSGNSPTFNSTTTGKLYNDEELQPNNISSDSCSEKEEMNNTSKNSDCQVDLSELLNGSQESDGRHTDSNSEESIENDSFDNIKFLKKRINRLNISLDGSEASAHIQNNQDPQLSSPIPSNESGIKSFDVTTELQAASDQGSGTLDSSERKSQQCPMKFSELNGSQSNITQVSFSNLPDVSSHNHSQNNNFPYIMDKIESDDRHADSNGEESIENDSFDNIKFLKKRINRLNISSDGSEASAYIQNNRDPQQSSPIPSNESGIKSVDVSRELHAASDQGSGTLDSSERKSQQGPMLNGSQSNITQVSFSDLPDVSSHNHSQNNNCPEIESDGELYDSTKFISRTKKKSKINELNFSTGGNKILGNGSLPTYKIDNDSPPIIPPKNRTFNNSEEDRYIYRVRSDSSSSSGSECSPINSKDSFEDVISIGSSTDEEKENNDEDAPWSNLGTYLKKNIPATSESVESSSSKNTEKRLARLANIQLPGHSSCPEHASFLLSLTPQVPDDACHPQAVKYRESFPKWKNELIDVLFKLFNKEIFDDKLPPIEIKWSGHLTTTSGITKSSSKITRKGKVRTSSIKLSKTIVDNAAIMRDVLLHELCHAANWLIDKQGGGHGPLFKKWVSKIWATYPEIPKVKTTHSYELKWKYLYKCTYCGYELGKMKLNLSENSCRLCGGLVTVN